MDYDKGGKVCKNLFLLIFLMSSVICKLLPTRLQIIDFAVKIAPLFPEFHCHRIQGRVGERGDNYFVPWVGHNQ